MLVYAIINQKGGVGKTTTTANLGAALALAGKRILLLDMDPQGSLTAAVGRTTGALSIGDVLREPETILNAIQRAAGEMHLISATATLSNVFRELDALEAPAFRLAKALECVQECYDYALIDCPPTLGHATTNAMTAAHVALIPLQCEFLSLRGLSDVEEIAVAIRQATNPDLRLRVVGTMYDRRTLHANEVLQAARTAFPGLVYETIIPRTVRLAEAPAHAQTIFEYAPESTGAYAYSLLAQEVLQEDTNLATSGRYSLGGTHSARLPEAA
ncbi:MAG TPA: ParA family protein [Chthonomonadaceae bacterium]|nr:ParA family protein [Chthonomonadaceae bacterium]